MTRSQPSKKGVGRNDSKTWKERLGSQRGLERLAIAPQPCVLRGDGRRRGEWGRSGLSRSATIRAISLDATTSTTLARACAAAEGGRVPAQASRVGATKATRPAGGKCRGEDATAKVECFDRVQCSAKCQKRSEIALKGAARSGAADCEAISCRIRPASRAVEKTSGSGEAAMGAAMSSMYRVSCDDASGSSSDPGPRTMPGRGGVVEFWVW